MSDAPETSEQASGGQASEQASGRQANAPAARKSRPWLRPLLSVFVPVFILAVIVFIARPIMLEMLQPPPRLLAPPSRVVGAIGTGVGGTAGLGAAPSTRIPRPNDPALNNAFGAGAVNLATRDIARHAVVAADALACGLRDQVWAGDLRNAAATDIARRTPSHDGATDDTALLRRYLTDRFAAAQQARAQGGVPDWAQRCADLPILADFRAADSLVRAHRAAPAR